MVVVFCACCGCGVGSRRNWSCHGGDVFCFMGIEPTLLLKVVEG